MEDIKVSIICDTYNQEDYIADALESFLMQDTEFAFEVLVHDDASTDGTAEIVAEYATRYPDIIKPYYEDTNQYTLGAPHNFAVQSARVSGKYVALCEGDDYWTDPHKLQLQYEALEQHQDIDICVHAGECINADTRKTLVNVRPKIEDGIIPVEDVIMGGGGFVVTNSIFMRAETYVHPPEIVATFNLDYMVQIWGAMRGGMYYIDRNMSAYRMFSKGSFTSRVLTSRKRTADHFLRVIEALHDLDAQTGRTHSEAINAHIDELEFNYNCYLGRFKKAFSSTTWQAKPLLARLRALPMILYNSLSYRLDKKRAK